MQVKYDYFRLMCPVSLMVMGLPLMSESVRLRISRATVLVLSRRGPLPFCWIKE